MVKRSFIFICVAISASLHAFGLFAIDFDAPEQNAKQSPSLNVTLSPTSSKEKPDQAEFTAMHDNVGSGPAEEVRELSSPYENQFQDTKQNRIQKSSERVLEDKLEIPRLITTITAPESIDQSQQLKEKQKQHNPTDDINPSEVSDQIATLNAQFRATVNELTKGPHPRRLSSVSTKSETEAAYLAQFREKVEMVATKNFPSRALNNDQLGSVTLEITIEKNGTIKSVQPKKSSGFSIIDNAAIQSVHDSFPLPPFPKSVKEEGYDQLIIYATWIYGKQKVSTKLASGS